MTLKDRILSLLSFSFYIVVFIWYTGEFLGLLFLLIPIVYIILGGKKHV